MILGPKTSEFQPKRGPKIGHFLKDSAVKSSISGASRGDIFTAKRQPVGGAGGGGYHGQINLLSQDKQAKMRSRNPDWWWDWWQRWWSRDLGNDLFLAVKI